MRGPAVMAFAALTLTGCGGAGSELFVVHRTGSIPGARLVLSVYDDGLARCNHGPRPRLEDARLLDAREIQRDLEAFEKRGLHLAPGPGSILAYRVTDSDGSVSFSDTSRGQPPVLFRVQAFTRRVAREACRLRR